MGEKEASSNPVPKAMDEVASVTDTLGCSSQDGRSTSSSEVRRPSKSHDDDDKVPPKSGTKPLSVADGPSRHNDKLVAVMVPVKDSLRQPEEKGGPDVRDGLGRDGTNPSREPMASAQVPFPGGTSPHQRPDGVTGGSMVDEIGIEPLPMSRSETRLRGIDHLPGAYSVEGIPTTQSEDFPTIVALDDLTTLESGLGVVEGAVLVDAEDAQATSQPDEEHQPDEVIEGRIMEEKGQTPRRSPRLFWPILLCVFLCGLVAVLTPMFLPKDEKESDSSVGTREHKESPAPLPEDYPPFQDGLAKAVRLAIEDADSPYHKANTWIWQDPHKESYPPEVQHQRFHMVAAYHFTNGAN